VSITAARLQAEVGADTKGFDKGMAHADSVVQKAPSKWGTALKVGAGVGLGIAAGVVVKGLVGAISGGLQSLQATGVVVAQTQAVIKSTGGAAKVTADQIRNLSERTEDLTAIDDKAVQAGANMLLTFTNIRNAAGKGNDVFNQSVAVLADMSTAMGTDMKSGAIQLGKALNDPVAGITALTRVGVTFTDQQKNQIKQLVLSGRAMDAQKVILKELNKEFGGSGAAFAATDTGKAAKFQDAIEGIQQSIATGLLPVVTRVRGQLTSFLSDPATIGQAQALGEAIAGIFSEGNLRTAANLMTTAAGAISTAIHLFSSLPPQVQALAVGALALKKITGIGPLDIVKGAGGALKILFERGASPANPMWVAQVGGGLPGVPGIGPAAEETGGLLGVVKSAAKWIVPIVAGAAVVELAQELNKTAPTAANQTNTTVGRYGAFATSPTAPSAVSDGKGMVTLANGFNTGFAKNSATVVGGFNHAVAGQTSVLANGFTVGTTKIAKIIAPKLDALHAAFVANLHSLIAATKANDVQKFARAVAADIGKGVGSVKGTKGVLADLKLKLTQTDDPKTRAVLLAAIKSVQAKLPNREWVSGQLAKADVIAKSSEATKTKIIDLTAIQKTLRDRGDTHAASLIGQKVTEMKNRVAEAAKAAGDTAAAATRRKKWQFTNNITVNAALKAEVSLRSYSTATATAAVRGNVFVPS